MKSRTGGQLRLRPMSRHVRWDLSHGAQLSSVHRCKQPGNNHSAVPLLDAYPTAGVKAEFLSAMSTFLAAMYGDRPGHLNTNGERERERVLQQSPLCVQLALASVKSELDTPTAEQRALRFLLGSHPR